MTALRALLPFLALLTTPFLLQRPPLETKNRVNHVHIHAIRSW